jgi:hypothetical protein
MLKLSHYADDHVQKNNYLFSKLTYQSCEIEKYGIVYSNIDFLNGR